MGAPPFRRTACPRLIVTSRLLGHNGPMAPQNGFPFDPALAARRLEQTVELTETLKELQKAADAANNPELTDSELERRFWRRMRRRREWGTRP